MSLPATASEALQAFAACPGWDQRARLQMQWGERLEPLSAEQCSNEHLVQGCASQVWLLGEEHEGRWYFQAASDARLLRGLLALLLGAGAAFVLSRSITVPLRQAAESARQIAAGDLTQAIDTAARTLGRLDILVNNAGVAVAGEIDSFALADFDHTLNVNVRAVFVATQAAVRHMGQGGAYGRVITIGSTNSDRVPWAGFSVYGMSKAAIVGLTKGLARDLGPRGITVNNVQPGPVNTDMNPADGPLASNMHGMMALGRHAHPDEIAGMVAYLAGPESGMVTGASLLIDGGFAA